MEAGLIIVAMAVVAMAVVIVVRRQRRRELAATVARANELRSTWPTVETEGEAVLGTTRALAADLTGASGVALDEQATALATSIEEARAAVGELAGSVDGGRSRGHTDTARREAERAVERVSRTMATAERNRAADRERLDALSGASATGQRRVEDGRTAVASIAERGWRVDDLVADLATTEEELTAVSLDLPLDLDRTEQQLRELTERAGALAAEAADRPERHRALLAETEALATRTADLRSDAEWLENQLEAWAVIHHPRSLQTVSEHPPAVTGRLDEADERLDEATRDGGLLAMDTQDLRGAADAVERAETVVRQADEMIAEARRLNVELATAAVEAPEAVREAERVVERFAAYVATHGHDLQDAFGGVATELASDVTDAGAGLQLDPPDSLGAMERSASIVDRTAARTKKAEAEVARMDRLRSRADQELRRARTAVSELDRYTSGILANAFGGGRRRNVDRLNSRLASASGLNQKKVNKPDVATREASAIATEARDLLQKYRRADQDTGSYDD